MKKFTVILMVVIALFAFTLCTYAEEEIHTEEPPTVTKTEESSVDYEKIAREVYDMVKEDLPKGLAENIAKLIEDWDKTENENATFADRIKEFFETDNLVSTVSMIFMIVVGCAVYIMKKKQSISIKSTNDDLRLLKNQIEEQIKDGKGIGGGVTNLMASIDKIYDFLLQLETKFNEKNDSSEKARLAAIGVATMLKDIFQNSRTIDEAGKKIMNLDYLKAIGESIESLNQETHKESGEVEV